MRARILVGFLALTSVLAIAVPAQAHHAVQVDMSDAFNKDVIVNGTTVGNIDETQATVDISETSFITQGAAELLANCTEDPDGLKNKGKYAENDDHPFVDLAWDNEKNGRNARRFPDEDSFRVSVTHLRYRAIHVFATSGNQSSTMRVKLIYGGDTSTVEEFTVADWFGPPTDGYFLTDNRDRAYPDASECHDDDAAAIFGFKVQADTTRTLRAVKIIRPDNDGSAVLNVFGMTGRRVGPH
jgi:hypothetical protein